jgi:tetratricopeptide (TPR) repeat protein
MSEPQRSEPTPAGGDIASPGGAAQVERLLLSGLDLYFAGQYQDAINVWTRVIFLERGHGRARAYIERARTAIAEQQRESDELTERGRRAYEAGDLDGARRLLTDALQRGGSQDDALALLQHLNRFGGEQEYPTRLPADASRVALAPEPDRAWVGVVAAIAVVSALALGAAPVVSWVVSSPGDSAAVAPGAVTASAPLPIVRTGAVAYARARDLYASGRLADALRSLERIDVGDPVHGDAERLRGDIQRDLLAAVRQATPAETAR